MIVITKYSQITNISVIIQCINHFIAIFAAPRIFALSLRVTLATIKLLTKSGFAGQAPHNERRNNEHLDS